MIPYGRQEISQADIDAVCEVLRSDFLTQGSAVPAFETAVKEFTGAGYAVAANSATSALHIACKAIGLGPGDVMWTAPNTFVASANAALYCGADVDFVDIDPRTLNICVVELERKLSVAKSLGRLPKVIMPVHYAGQPCEMAVIHALSKEYGFRVIEDASHAIGASYKGSRVGSCQHSDITVFSFHPVKIVTSGEGGMATTCNKTLYDSMLRLRSHGITTDPNLMRESAASEIWNYQQIELGYNYRLSDIHAALGLSQLGKLEEFIRRRAELARRYDKDLSGLPYGLPHFCSESVSSYHLYPIRVRPQGDKINQKIAYKGLVEAGIAANLHYIPVHRQPFYERLGFKEGDYPNAEQFHREALSLPIFPGLTDEHQSRVVQTLRRIAAES